LIATNLFLAYTFPVLNALEDSGTTLEVIGITSIMRAYPGKSMPPNPAAITQGQAISHTPKPDKSNSAAGRYIKANCFYTCLPCSDNIVI
jgi:hypothetical protein